ncbi:MAG TPA: glycosyltransferase family protein [Solimonas sp.]|nr:glycosyltransferase family protein [Solimonas sp.]
MRIAYGVMGYGRGHAMRTMSVLPSLMQEHEVTVFAGGDAYDVLAPLFPTVRIPLICYQYNELGQHSIGKLIARNAAPMADLLLGGPGMEAIEREFRDRGIQLAISDSEAWIHRTARNLGIPRISFDHVGVIAYCKPHFPPDLWLAGMRDAIGYRAAMGVPERILISSFYPAEPRYPGVHIVGPMMRDEVRRVKPKEGDYLLCYFNKGEHQFLPHIDRALRLLDCPVVIYGTPYRGKVENLDFRAPSNEWFVHDLANCRAVLSTAGNGLTGEAIHFGKPLLVMPERAFEQRLNAYMIERMGVGMRTELERLTPSDVDRFMGNYDYYRSNMGEHARDGRAEATATLHRFIDELGGVSRGRPKKARAQKTGAMRVAHRNAPGAMTR